MELGTEFFAQKRYQILFCALVGHKGDIAIANSVFGGMHIWIYPDVYSIRQIGRMQHSIVVSDWVELYLIEDWEIWQSWLQDAECYYGSDVIEHIS